MCVIPIPKWQSLSAARMYISKLASKGAHPQEIESSLFAAFRDGTLEARAHRYDDDSDAHNLEAIPIAFWRSLEAHEFHRFLNNDGNTTAYARIGDETPRYKNAEILTSALDKWLGIKKGGTNIATSIQESSTAKKFNLVTNAPAPISAAKGVSIGRKEFYAVPVKDGDYLRCITDGNIKVHRLAALACDLSPAGNISDGTNRLYNESLYNSDTQLGLIFDKLRYAVDSKKIKIAVYRSTEANLISLNEGIDWLEREGIEVSKRLKDYAAIRASESSPFITVTQAISWITFGDFDAINRTLTPQESEKIELAKSSFLKFAQAGNLTIYGVNPKHTGSTTASSIVPREQILTLVSLGNHLIYKGENWINLEVEKSKVLELWQAANPMPAVVIPVRKSGRNKGDGSFLNKDAPFILLAEKEWPHDSAKKAAEKLVVAHSQSIDGQSDESKIDRLRKRITQHRKGGLDLNGFEPFLPI